MHFALIHKLAGFTYYGDIPEIPKLPDDRFELFPLSFEDRELLMPFIVDINNMCDTTLDFGDVDFFDKEKCILLESYIKNLNEDSFNQRLLYIFSVLKDFAQKAQVLGTGIVLELQLYDEVFFQAFRFVMRQKSNI